MEWPNEGDQVSSGPSPTDPQGFDHRTEKINSHGNLPVIGAPDGDEEEPSMANKITPDPSLDPQQGAPYSRRPDHPAESHRVPYSDQLPVPASFKGFDHRTEKGNSHGKLPVSGAQDGDESKPSKKKNMSPAPKTGPQVAPHSGRPNHRGESHRVPDSDQGDDHSQVKESSYESLPVSGAPDSDKIKTTKKNKKTPAPRMAPDITESHRVSDSAIPAYFKKQSGAEEQSGDRASSGPSPTDLQGFDNRIEKQSRHGNLPVSASGAQDGDESKPSKKKNMSPAPKTGPQVAPHSGRPNHRGESHRVPDSDQDDDHRKVKESSYENPPVSASGAADSDKIKRTKETKKTPAPRTAPGTTESHDSAVPATFKKQSGAEEQSDDQVSSGQSPTDPQEAKSATFTENPNKRKKADSSTDTQDLETTDIQEIEDLKASLESAHQQIADLQRDNTKLRSTLTAIKSEKQSGAEVQSGDQASSGQSPPDPQEIEDLKASLESAHQQIADLQRDNTELQSIITAIMSEKQSGDDGPSGDRASSGQSPTVSQELMSLKVPPDLHIAAETLGKYYLVRDNDPNIKKYFKTLVKVLKESHSESSKTWSSHARTVKVHKILTGKTFGADEALLKQLNCNELQVKMTDRQGCDIIILFCPINSRVGSDVDLAMRQVSGEERVILILMHHTRDVDYSTAAKRWSETFDNVIFDVNVLYHPTVPGLLKCPKNTEAISDIRKELMQYSSSTNQSSNSQKLGKNNRLFSLFSKGK